MSTNNLNASASALAVSGMDTLLDRLQLLNYSARFCTAKKMKPMNPDLFAQPHAANPTYQLNYFYTLLAWLVSLASSLDGIAFQAPSELDDPNVTANNAVTVLKTAGIPPPSTETDWNPSKLRQGYGESVLAALTGMADRALKGSGFVFKKPMFDKNEQFEEAQTDDAAEIGNPGASTEADDIPEDETLFGGHGGGLPDVDQDQPQLDADADTNVDSVLSGIFRKSAITSTPTSPQRPATAAGRSVPRLAMIKGRSQTNLGAGPVDPEAWRSEVERVTPRLKVHLKDDHKQWRVHVSAMSEYRALIANEWGWGDGNNGSTTGSASSAPSSQAGAAAPAGGGGKAIVTRLLTDLDSTLEKLRSRESYVNTQLDALVDTYREVQSRLGALRLEYNTGSEKMGALAQDLQRISYELEEVKALMDDLGSGMTDSKPLLNIKSTLQRLKTELKQMEVRRGVLEHQLMSGRIRHKTRQVMASSGAAGRATGFGGQQQRKGARQQQGDEPFAFMFMGSPEMAI